MLFKQRIPEKEKEKVWIRSLRIIWIKMLLKN